MMKKLLAVLFIACFVWQAQAAHRHIKNGVVGNDTLQRVSAAIAALSAGDTIFIDGYTLDTTYSDPKARMCILGTNRATATAKHQLDTMKRAMANTQSILYPSKDSVYIEGICFQPDVTSTFTTYTNPLFTTNSTNGVGGWTIRNCSWVDFWKTGSDFYGLTFSRSGADKYCEPSRVVNCYFRRCQMACSQNKSDYTKMASNITIDSCYGDSSRIEMGDSMTVKNTTFNAAPGDDPIRVLGIRDSIINVFVDDKKLGYEVISADYSSTRPQKNFYGKNIRVWNSSHVSFCFDAIQNSTVDGIFDGVDYGVWTPSPDSSIVASLYNHNNRPVGDTCMTHTTISHFTCFTSNHKVTKQLIYFADSSTSKGSKNFRYSHFLLLEKGGQVKFQYAYNDTLDSTLMIDTCYFLKGGNTTLTDTASKLTAAAVTDTTKFGYSKRNSTIKTVWPNGSYSGMYKYLINRTGSPVVGKGTIAARDSLDENFWHKFPVEKDSATIYYQTSTDKSNWTTRDSAVMKKAGWADSLRASGLAAGKTYDRFITLTSSNSGSLRDTTEIDSGTVESTSPVINTIIPDSCAVNGGIKIAINGTSFHATLDTVYFGTLAGTMVYTSTTICTVTVPSGLTRGTQKLYFHTPAGIDSAKTFYGLKPNISYSPASYTDTLTVASPGYTASSSLDPWDSVSITPALPTGLSLNSSTGAITGTPSGSVQALTAYKAYAWLGGIKQDSGTVTIGITARRLTPVITSITPDHGDSALTTTAVIAGSNFLALQGGNGGVKFGSKTATVTAWADDEITVTMTNPDATGDQNVIVKNDSLMIDTIAFRFFGTPDAPQLWTPVNRAVNQSITTKLDWAGSPNGYDSIYHYQVSSDASFSSVTEEDTIPQLKVTTASLANLTKYYWRVRSLNSDTVGPFAEAWDYTTIIAAPSSLSYAGSPAKCSTTVAASFAITNGGSAVDSFAVTSGSLPAGLSLAKLTGTISGTPTTVTASGSVTVTAYNVGGTGTASFSSQVYLGKPNFSYVTQSLSLTKLQEMGRDSAISTGGATDSFTVSPALPDSVLIDKTTGAIYGTPLDSMSLDTFTVTAHNESGTKTYSLYIRVRLPVTNTDAGSYSRLPYRDKAYIRKPFQHGAYR